MKQYPMARPIKIIICITAITCGLLFAVVIYIQYSHHNNTVRSVPTYVDEIFFFDGPCPNSLRYLETLIADELSIEVCMGEYTTHLVDEYRNMFVLFDSAECPINMIKRTFFEVYDVNSKHIVTLCTPTDEVTIGDIQEDKQLYVYMNPCPVKLKRTNNKVDGMNFYKNKIQYTLNLCLVR